MKELDIDLHVGQDFGITYIIENCITEIIISILL